MGKKFLLLGKILGLLNFIFPLRRKPGIYVSYSHHVKRNELDKFEGLLTHISKEHTFISPQAFFEYLDKGKLAAGKSVLMTFDDGFLSSYQAAKKILNKHGIKAIFFIPTAILELKTEKEMLEFTAKNIYFNTKNIDELVPDEYLFMNETHLKDLANDGHMICPHTYSHIWIKDIDDEQKAIIELRRPQELIEEMFDTPVRAFAFPVGTERQVDKFAYEQIYHNYDYCFTALTGNNTYGEDKHKLYRFNLPPEATFSYIDRVLSGGYDLYYRYKMKVLTKKTK